MKETSEIANRFSTAKTESSRSLLTRNSTGQDGKHILLVIHTTYLEGHITTEITCTRNWTEGYTKHVLTLKLLVILGLL